MKIAVLSGKGGTGKTLLAVNLAAVAENAIYCDCDVEEPNGYLFLKPTKVKREPITTQIPVVNNRLCNGCRKCVDFCNFNALAYANDKLMIFEEICHSCGGCVLFCPQKALTEKEKVIGEIQKGVSGNIKVLTGMMNTGEVTGVPIVKKLIEDIAPQNTLTFIDCSPGSDCIVMECVQSADYCVLVAEPTLFGAHNLEMVFELVTLLGKPYGAVLNKCLEGENPSEIFCRKKGINILGKIPFDHDLGTLNSNALIAAKSAEKYQHMFFSLLQKITKEVRNETTLNP